MYKFYHHFSWQWLVFMFQAISDHVLQSLRVCMLFLFCLPLLFGFFRSFFLSVLFSGSIKMKMRKSRNVVVSMRHTPQIISRESIFLLIDMGSVVIVVVADFQEHHSALTSHENFKYKMKSDLNNSLMIQ